MRVMINPISHIKEQELTLKKKRGSLSKEVPPADDNVKSLVKTIKCYTLFTLSLLVLLVLPTDFLRLAYLHALSAICFISSNDNRVKVYVFLGVTHSIVHNLFPFLTTEGFDATQDATFDVMLHLIMMGLCYKHVRESWKEDSDKKRWFDFLSIIFLLGSSLNVVAAYFQDGEEYSPRTLFFVNTSIFQAVSTGYWVGVTLWQRRHQEKSFFAHWLFWIVVMSVNWFIYKFSEPLVGISMHFRYVEAVFITCIWVGALTN